MTFKTAHEIKDKYGWTSLFEAVKVNVCVELVDTYESQLKGSAKNRITEQKTPF